MGIGTKGALSVLACLGARCAATMSYQRGCTVQVGGAPWDPTRRLLVPLGHEAAVGKLRDDKGLDPIAPRAAPEKSIARDGKAVRVPCHEA